MHRNLESTSELTEFAPLSPEDKSSFGLLGFSKFFKLGRGSETAEPDKEKTNGNNKTENDWQTSGETSESDSNANLQYSLAISEGRSLPNVLKRISNLVALKSVGLTSYKNTDLKQYWMPDSFSKECYECGEKFTTFRRRHHCRVCGQIFCSGCCNQEIPGKIMGCTGDLRVCTYCCKVVLSYLQSADIGADLSADLRALQEDLQIKFGNSNVKNADNFQTGNVSSSALSEKGETSTNIRRKPSVGYQEEIFVMGHAQSPSYLSEEERCRALQNSASLRNLYEEILRPPDGISLQSHRYRLRSFPNCFFGNELVDWLISRNKAGTRVQGVAMGQALLEAGYLQAVGELNFVDGLSLYRPVSLVTPSNSEASSSNDGQEPFWVKQIPQQDSNVTPSSESSSDKFLEVDEENLQKSNSNYFLNINVKDHIVHVSRPSPPLQDGFQSMEKTFLNQGKCVEPSQEKVKPQKETTDIMMNTNWDKTSTFEPQIDKEDPCHQNLSSAFEHHRQSLLRQMLNTEGLSQSWTDTVQKVVSDVVDLVRPDMKNDKEEMDIRLYVQIKKLPGGQRSDSSIVSGIVCSKHVAHRSMRSVIANPRILLLRCSVAYERIEGRLLTLEPVIMQEHEYLKHVVARIASLQPDIVMVYRNVSRLAQEYLLKLGITLVINTKLSILERVSRFTQADIVTSVDAHISKPQLGTCKSFYLRTYQTENCGSKTLMFFEGSSNPSLGCSLILRGGTASELKKLKKIVHFMIFACYNWKLEESYLMDEFAKPPTTPFLLLEDSPDQDSGSVFPGNKVEAKVKVDKEDKKVMVETVSDCSDPLQSYLNHTDDVAPKPLEASPTEQLSVAELPFTNKFRKALDDTILSVSLYIKFSVPYLETEAGRNCILRRYFPEDIFYSKHFLEKSELNRFGSSVEHPENNSLDCQLKGVKLLPKHPFVLAKMTETVNSVEVQSLLALFRANGGRIPLTLSEAEKKEIRENSQSHTKKETPAKKAEMLDVLDPINHQRLPVLFCSYSSTSQNFPAFCVDPWVVNMYFYGMYDIPLGSFLERYCFRSSYVCPSVTCSTPMLEHVRRFVHDPGCISLTLSRLEEFESKQIVMWSWCPYCQSGTPMVPMSSNTWSMSFAKYLELRFRGHVYTRRDNDFCRHSLHHDHLQYFGMNKIIALFKFSTITIWEICLPPPVINVQFEMTPQNVIMDELRNLAIKGHEIYSSVLERLHNLEGNEEDIQLMKLQQQKDHGNFKAKIEEIQLKLTSPASENKKSDGGRTADREAEALMWWIEDSMVYLKRLISEAVLGWNARLQDALNAAKKKDDKEKEKVKKSSEHHRQSSQISVQLDGVDVEDKDEDFGDETVLDTTISPFRQLSDSMTESVDDSDDNLSSRYSTSDIYEHDKVPEDQKEKKSHPETIVSCDEYQTDSKHNKKSVTNILSHILTSNKDFVLMPNPWSSQEHYLLPMGPNACIMVHENEPSSIIAYALASYEYQRFFEEIAHRKLLSSSSEVPVPSPISRRKTLSFSSNSERESEGPESRRSTVLSFLRGNQSSGTLNVAKGNSADGSHVLNSSGTSDNGNLNPLDQDEKSEEGVKRGSKTSPSAHIQVVTAAAPDLILGSSTYKSSNVNLFLQIVFSDSTTNFYCRVYFAEQFAALRQMVFPIGEEAFVRSLSRCVHWAARGGKSGSTFCKTKDDRFVLKEMSKLELQLFLEFATHYFSYIQKCHESNQPTLLGKIVGVYTVTCRSTSNNSTLKCNLLVMENLFYKKNVTQKYDLKGSIRNRLVNPSLQKEGEIVYLDENLLQMTTDSPLYILSHSQAVLMKAIESDTQFLASQAVMDYSLLVGLDEDKRELVVGIIDYIRTFTWDKKLETMVKKTVIMGGQGKQPTVIQPKDYRDRFIAAMHRYFLPVPDRWSGLGKTMEL